MTIDEVVSIAKRIHDAEGWNLGSASTRESRNAFWERAIGCVFWGHPVYNPAPDSRWNVKDAGGGRPMSDDVVVMMPSRQFWDCIGGAGADGYTFHPNGHPEPLGPEQNVFAPRRPEGSTGVPGPAPAPPSQPAPAALDLTSLLQRLDALAARCDTLGARVDAMGPKMDAMGQKVEAAAGSVSGVAATVDDTRRRLEDVLAEVLKAVNLANNPPEYTASMLGQNVTLRPRR